jgi:hypothetical protein
LNLALRSSSHLQLDGGFRVRGVVSTPFKSEP